MVDHGFDQRGLTFFLIFDCLIQGRSQFIHRVCNDTLQATCLGDTGVRNLLVQLGANKVVIEPQGRVPLFRTPLVVAEDDVCDRWPFATADCCQLVHRDAERAVTREADNRNIGWQAISAGAEQARCEVFPAFVEVRVCVADRAVVADVRGNDRLTRQCLLNRTPCHAGRHPLWFVGTRTLVPCGARIVIFVGHGGQLLLPSGFLLRDIGLAVRPACIARCVA